jgi:hypothetical protein
MRTREAKHPLHGSAWLQKRGHATIDNQLSERLQIFLALLTRKVCSLRSPTRRSGQYAAFSDRKSSFRHDPMEILP